MRSGRILARLVLGGIVALALATLAWYLVPAGLSRILLMIVIAAAYVTLGLLQARRVQIVLSAPLTIGGRDVEPSEDVKAAITRREAVVTFAFGVATVVVVGAAKDYAAKRSNPPDFVYDIPAETPVPTTTALPRTTPVPTAMP
jgi:hypothetical protein